MTEIKLTYTVRDSATPPREASYQFPLSLAPPPVLAKPAPAAMSLTINTELRVEFPELKSGFTPYTYVLDGELPPGLEFDGETRMLTGTPSAAGAKSLTYRAFDYLGARGTASGVVGAPLEVEVAAALPRAPEDLAARPADRRLRLSWAALERNDITNYRVRWSVGRDTTDWVAAGGGEEGVSTGSADPVYVLRNLTNATVYSVQVAAENNLGAGDWSATLNSDPSERLAFNALQKEVVLALGIPLSQPVTLVAAEHGEGDVVYALEGLNRTLGETLSGLTWDENTRQLDGTLMIANPQQLPINVVATYTATDSSTPTPVSDQLEFNIRLVTFDLDLDTADTDTAAAANARDGVIAARYLLGVRGASLLHGQSNGDVAAHESALKDGADSTALDVDGDGDADGDDG
ncbi:MAG: putative Ig domain-containing protein, partial [Pirellulales bacterium]|nr:putative Ig domain-containing protein [Pirellulales bacterium]